MSEYIPLWQSINYIGLSGVTLVLCGACVLYHLHYRREFAAIVSAIYFAISSVAYFLLSIATGLRPIIATDAIRPWIQACRSLQLLALLWLLIVLSQRVLRNGDKHD